MIRRTHRVARATILVSSLAGSSCLHDSEGSAFLAPGVNDLDLASSDFWFEDGILAAEVAEDGVDRNGDGDGLDLELRILDVKSGRTTTIPDVVGAASVSGRRVAFLVPEDGAAGDRNGDGDSSDLVLHVHDVETGTTRGTGLACDHAFAQDGALLAFGVPESAQGADLDGDGELLSTLAYAYEADRDLVTPLGIAMWPESALVAGRRIVLQADEARAGDLNDDGDRLDAVVHVYDVDKGVLANTRRACDDVRLDGPLLALVVPEWENGYADLNGNGRQDDTFAELHDLDAGTVHLTAEESCVIQGLGGDLAVLFVETPFEPGGYRVFDRPKAAMHEAPGLSALYTDPSSLCDRRFAYLVDEDLVDVDLDGDGQMLDSVLHMLDARTGELGCASRAAYSTPQLDTNCVVFLGLSTPATSRPPTHTSVHVQDLRTGAIRDLRIMATDFFLEDDRIVALTSEAWQNADLNADMDLDDTIVQVHDLATGRTRNTGLPSAPYFGDWRGMELDGDVLVVNVDGRLKAVRLR